MTVEESMEFRLARMHQALACRNDQLRAEQEKSRELAKQLERVVAEKLTGVGKGEGDHKADLSRAPSVYCPFFEHFEDRGRTIVCEGLVKGTMACHKFKNKSTAVRHIVKCCTSMDCAKKCEYAKILTARYEEREKL